MKRFWTIFISVSVSVASVLIILKIIKNAKMKQYQQKKTNGGVNSSDNGQAPAPAETGAKMAFMG